MRLTRRNTLAVLLVLVAAGGMVGTGAFSTVNADRTVTIDTAGDQASGTNVEFDVKYGEHDALSNNGADDTIGFDFDDVNVDANTTYEDVLDVTVNGDSGEDYKIEVTSAPTNMKVNFDGDDTVIKGSGNKATADISLDTTGDTSASAANVSSGTITFEVTNQEIN